MLSLARSRCTAYLVRFNASPRGFLTRGLVTASESKKALDILFLGRDEFSCLVLTELYAASDVWDNINIVTYPDTLTGKRRSHVSVSPLKTLGNSLRLPVDLIPEEKAEFKHFQPPERFASDALPHQYLNRVLVTASFGRILTSKFLNFFDPKRRLNVHGSVLPAYRGAAPIQHAIMNKESETGVSVVQMLERSKGIDAGAVLGTTKVPIQSNMFYSSLRDDLGVAGGKLLVNVLRDILLEKATFMPQQLSAVTYAPSITSAMAAIDFTAMPADEIVRRYHAISHQRPLTITVPTGQTVQLHEVAELDRSSVPDWSWWETTPGTAVYHAPSRNILVRCANDSVLAVSEVRQQGKALAKAGDWWNGMKGLGLVNNRELNLGHVVSVG